jgi:hypothetical protein
MTTEAVRILLVGALFTFIALARGLTSRLPLSGAMIYLLVGVVIGPVVSLFAIRIHLRVPERDRLWMLPLRLCGPAMLVTIELMSGFNARRRALARHDALSCGHARTNRPRAWNELRVKGAGDDEPVNFALSGRAV